MFEHRKTRKRRKGKLKLGKTLEKIAENAERFGKLKLGSNEHLKTRKTRISKLKLVFLKHELTRINHELTINGWRGFLFLAENAESADFTIYF